MHTLGLFVKHPTAGEVKTRLAGEVGVDQAAKLYAAFLRDLIDRFRRFPAERRLGFTPDEPAARSYFERLAAADYRLWPQPARDLGERLRAFFRDHVRNRDDRAVVIGSDSPTLPSDYVRDAFERLDAVDVILGPAADGGYYLLGMRYPPAEVFRGISWSEATVLEETVERLRDRRRTFSLLPVWYDVDSPEDLRMLRGHLAAMSASGAGHDCPATWSALIRAD
jgi:rSAM/selenodomain-associated transferase 1